ncbi:MAG: septum formation protein Maf [Gammaproteobacteria bacterium]|nr:septum formation protein Maf [Gammaproteobacteria bacterium]MBT5406262.1 septum formation protein Maf [Gammaproteobacteria bacterium]MBT5643537.1 septum formation protein Maf [Gammaproteobacteria bacterium]MBT5863666.1 septum formation protein Maf [Gammaproteobacteria bacterium]MBT6733764.1 septum formation protein Maf [Gammaproteobacteria bacterium]|tara:strand:+ start:502 stop:1077 length:576 start_codon:yes stop_codon:yes gene_type:complete
MRKIILASSSIHRKKLLKQIKLNFIAISPDIDESRNKNESVNKFVKRLSIEKAMKIAVLRKNSIVIGSDEIAVVDDKILGKPLTKKNARKQLNLISGKKVIFKTGICVIDTNTMKKLSSVVNYSIKMRKISKNTINNYIDKEDMLNCAASIRIEGLAISLIEKATGEDPTSVIGLPLITLITYLEKLGYKS